MRNFGLKCFASGRSRIGVLLAIIVVVIVAFAYSPTLNLSKMRGPNPHETFYQYIAFEFDAPALCDKLSPTAILPGGIFIAASYARSDCYASLARRFDRPSLCWSAKRLGSLALLSEQTSRLSCFWNVFRRAPDPGISTYMPDRKDLVTIFTEMGYRPEELYREGVTPPLLNLSDAYRRLALQPDLLPRIARITAMSPSPTPLTSAERMRLFELAAHVSGDVSWCARIPADLLDPGSLRQTKGPSLFQRDRCILEVASDTRAPDSCQLIPVRPDDWPGLMSRHSLCELQASRPPDKYHYGALPPQTDAETREVITLLGYPLPDVRDVSANEIESGYYYFIWQLARGEAVTNSRGTSANDGAVGTSAAVAAARTKFLGRVAALPSYH